VWQWVTACRSVIQGVAVCCSVLPHIAACCSVLQYVVLCCSELREAQILEVFESCHVKPPTEEIQLGIITTAKISTSFHGRPRNIHTNFQWSPHILQRVFMGVNRVPVTQMIYQETG